MSHCLSTMKEHQMHIFKPGDRVVYDSEEYILLFNPESTTYPLIIKSKRGDRTFTTEGKAYTSDTIPALKLVSPKEYTHITTPEGTLLKFNDGTKVFVSRAGIPIQIQSGMILN